MSTNRKQVKRKMRHKRIRAKVKGTAQCPRFSVFRSNKYIYIQLIDDEKAKTIVSASSQEVKEPAAKRQTKTKKKQKGESDLSGKEAIAFETGRLAAKKALKKNIKRVVFDRSGYKYHGRVKAAAEAARKEGLKF